MTLHNNIDGRGMMRNRDDGPGGIPAGDLDAIAEGGGSRARRDAERIARDARNMNALLAAMGEGLGERIRTAVDEAVDEAADEAVDRIPVDAAVVPLRRPASTRRVMVGLAAAAAIAALILVRGGETEEAGGPLEPAAPSMVSEMDVEADRPFAVFPTNDPNIAVVWLLDLEESE